MANILTVDGKAVIVSSKALVADSGDDQFSQLIERTFSGVNGYYENSAVSYIGSGTFMYCNKLNSVSFPNVSFVYPYGFYWCSITAVYFPSCTTVGSSAFYNCYRLSTMSFPECTIISTWAFYNCNILETISFPKCTSIGGQAFYMCSKLSSISFPKCIYIGPQAFYMCSSLTTAYFPDCDFLSNNAFQNCTSLAIASFPKCTVISTQVFQKCYNLLSLYLMNSSICTLSNSNTFSSTPIAGYTTSTGGTYGSIYVPSSLLTSYKNATNWTYFSNRMVGI